MTDLGQLKVSLTKHNAHKVARLLKEYEASEVFNRLSEIGADAAQTRVNLSALSGDVLPPIWENVRVLGPDAIDALILLAIIFSHNLLIKAMTEATDRRKFFGRIDRAIFSDVKVYTNFARVVDQLGYVVELDRRGFTFNLKGMFAIPGLGPLVGELLEMKLAKARWDRSKSLVDEAIHLGFQNVFGISVDDLKGWLTVGAQPSSARSNLSASDQEFFEDETEGTAHRPFTFRPGHVERDVEPLARSASAQARARRLHNDIQNKLYTYLRDKLGEESVGTELDTGGGTSIDLATRHRSTMTFYEIKTGASVRSSIRQALPQLLEYAFWPETDRADELIIVSHLAITPDANRYLRYLRKRFHIPISYQQFDLERNVLR